MPTILKWIIGLIVFFIFGYWYVHKVKAPELRPLVQNKINENLSNENLSHIKANVDSGLHVSLDGVVSNEDEKSRAVEACKVCGNGDVNTDALQAGSIDKYNFFAERYIDPNERVLLKGLVPNQSVKDAILKKAEELYGAGNFVDQIEVENFNSSEVAKFQNLAIAALPYLSNFNGISSLEMNMKETIYKGQYNQVGLNEVVKERLTGVGGSSYNVSFPSVTIVTTTIATTTSTIAKVNCQEEINSLLAGEKILFNTSDYSVSSDSFSLLRSLASSLGKCPKWGVRVEGHTDTRGKASFNQTLSENRANAVKNKLIELGVGSSRIDSKGFGESRPLNQERNAAELAANRRIEIILQGE